MQAFLSPDVKVLLPDGTTRRLADYLLPSALLMVAAFLLVVSLFLPYWRMTMFAPQYPKGLSVAVYVTHLEGDMREIDELNHYLGMPKLDEGGRLERSLAPFAIGMLGFLLFAGIFVHNQWAGIFALPALGFPIIFVLDLWWILYNYGHSIDPTSALGGAIEPFTPPLLGPGVVGQFKTMASFELGMLFALISVVVTLVGLWYHRAAYKPVVEARRRVLAQAKGA